MIEKPGLKDDLAVGRDENDDLSPASYIAPQSGELGARSLQFGDDDRDPWDYDDYRDEDEDDDDDDYLKDEDDLESSADEDSFDDDDEDEDDDDEQASTLVSQPFTIPADDEDEEGSRKCGSWRIESSHASITSGTS